MEEQSLTVKPPIRKTFSPSWWVFVLIECFSVWQMGIMYYSTHTFTVSGVTPLPISVGNVTVALALGYIAGALLAYLLPKRTAAWGKTAIAVSLACTLLLFFDIPDRLFVAAYFVIAFCCAAFISVDSVLMVNAYSSKAAVTNAICSGILVGAFTPLVQNDLFHVSFPAFNICAVILQILILIGLFCLPKQLPITFLPKLPKKERSRPPTILTAGTFILFAAACLTCLFCATMAESLPNGIAVTYLSGGIGAVVFLLFFRRGVNPFHLTTVGFASIAFGFLLWMLPFPAAQYAGLVFQGISISFATLCWFFAGVLFESWPSRIIAPLTSVIALAAVIVNTGLMEVLRGSTPVLYSIYAVLAISVLILYFLIKPFYEQAWRRATAEKTQPEELPVEEEAEPARKQADAEPAEKSLDALTPRERETAELLMQGYTAADIAVKLVVSVYTVRDHTKNIYRKLDVHNRYELIFLMTGQRAAGEETETMMK